MCREMTQVDTVEALCVPVGVVSHWSDERRIVREQITELLFVTGSHVWEKRIHSLISSHLKQCTRKPVREIRKISYVSQRG